MTLDELNKIRYIVEYSMRKAKTDAFYESCKASLLVVEREIKLKTMNPVTGRMIDVSGNVIDGE